jgi:hypothetical protein
LLIPMGAMPKGAETSWPNRVVRVDRSLVSTSWRGRILCRKKACLLARWVCERPALEEA